MAILFIQSGAVAIFFNREIAKISRIKPDSDYSFTRMINATLEVQALNIISASIFLFFITYFFYYLDKKLGKLRIAINEK